MENSAEVRVGSLVRYKHDHDAVGLVLKFDNSRATYAEDRDTGDHRWVANDNIFVAWQNRGRSWFVEARYIQVMGEGNVWAEAKQ